MAQLKETVIRNEEKSNDTSSLLAIESFGSEDHELLATISTDPSNMMIDPVSGNPTSPTSIKIGYNDNDQDNSTTNSPWVDPNEDYIPKEKVDVEGAVRAYEFKGTDEFEVISTLKKLLPQGVNLKNTSKGGNPVTGKSSLSTSLASPAGIRLVSKNGLVTNSIIGVDTNTISGTLNDDVGASPDGVYPAKTFQDATKGSLKLQITDGQGNWETLVDIDLTTGNGGSLSESNTNTSGNDGDATLSVGAAQPLQFPTGQPFEGVQVRTGSWSINESVYDAATSSTPLFRVRVIHEVTQSDVRSTNGALYFYDKDPTQFTINDTIPSFGFLNFSKVDEYDLSGVSYNKSATADFAIPINDVYKNTYKNKRAITFPNQENCTIPSQPIPELSPIQDETFNTTFVFQASSKDVVLFSPFESAVRVEDTVENRVQSKVDSAFNMLVSNKITNENRNAPILNNNFTSEKLRIEPILSGSIQNVTYWNSSNDLTGGQANYNNGLQVYPDSTSVLKYPQQNFDISEAPSGNPDYSQATGSREYYSYFEEDNNTAFNFGLTITANGTLTAKSNLNSQTDEFSMEVRFYDFDGSGYDELTDSNGTALGWLDVAVAATNGGAAKGSILQKDPNTNGDPFGITSGATPLSLGGIIVYRITMAEQSSAEVENVSIEWL